MNLLIDHCVSFSQSHLRSGIFLYIQSPKGTPSLMRQKTEQKRLPGTQHSRGWLPTATEVGFFSQACCKQDFYLQQHWELNANLCDRHKTLSPVYVMEWISSTNSLGVSDEQVKTGTLKNNNTIQPSQNQNLALISTKCRRGSSSPERHDLLYLLFSTL